MAGHNPWDAPTLEWSVPSPPPVYNFAVIPIIANRYPLWEGRLHESDARSSLDDGYLLLEGRETMGTTAMDATADLILKMPGDSFAPFALSVFLSLLCAALLLHWPILSALMLLGCAGSIIGWLWPQKDLLQRVDHLTDAA